MRTIAAIVWLVRGPGQNLFEQPEVQVQQERAVEEKETPAAALSVAGTLQAANGKVGLAPPFDGCLNELGKGIAVALKDELIGGGDAVEWSTPGPWSTVPPPVQRRKTGMLSSRQAERLTSVAVSLA